MKIKFNYRRLFLSTLAICAVAVGWGFAPQNQPSTAYLPLVARNYRPNSPFGITIYSNVNVGSGINQMAAAGSGWVVTMVWWASVEPQAPVSGVHTYDWSGLDATLATIRAAGVRPFVLVTGNPTWAAQYVAGPLYPGRADDLMAFLTAAAARYPDIQHWSLYPEPDNGVEAKAAQGWGYWGNNGSGYAALLAQAAVAIEAGNPAAKLLMSGIAYDFWAPPDGHGYFVKRFLDDVLQALNTSHGGVHQVIDGVSFHYYRLAFPRVQDKAAEIRSILARHGAEQLPLWIPETGFASNMAGSSETLQAQQLVQLHTEALVGGVQMMSWLGVFDVDATQNSIGLFRGTDLNQPKPAYTAYQIMTQELYGAEYLSTLSTPDAAAYQFRLLDGKLKTVVWGTQSGGPTLIALSGSCFRIRGILDTNLQTITDGSPGDNDGSVNGQIALVVGYQQPVYVTGC